MTPDWLNTVHLRAFFRDVDRHEPEEHHRHRQSNSFIETSLVSDGSVPAATVDPNLVNPWGIASSGQGPFWVADNGTGVTTVYDGAGHLQSVGGFPAITIAPPSGSSGPTSPTGEVFNFAKAGFNISSGGKTAPALFIFATEDGTISGWNPAVNPGSTVLAVDNSAGGDHAVYKGLAIGKTGEGTFLYAANFSKGTVDVFDTNFKQVQSFTDPNVPAGYAPFNVQVLDHHLFVTFAQQDAEKHDDVAGAGHGFVDEFSLGGQLVDRVASGGPLNSPWGLAIAPSGFGPFSQDLLVGNFGDGTINVFDPHNDHYLGKLDGANGQPIQIQDLWSLTPGTGAAGSDPHKIYFTAGLQDEQHGLFGSLGAPSAGDTAGVDMGRHHHG
jgi:uncharacterized protein (TIGR03118 family)